MLEFDHMSDRTACGIAVGYSLSGSWLRDPIKQGYDVQFSAECSQSISGGVLDRWYDVEYIAECSHNSSDCVLDMGQ